MLDTLSSFPKENVFECSVLIDKFVRGNDFINAGYSRIKKQSASLLLVARINILAETHSKDKKKMLNPVTPPFILGTLNLYVVL